MKNDLIHGAFFKKHWEKFIILFTITIVLLFLFYNSGNTHWWEWVIISILAVIVIWQVLIRFFPSFEIKKHVSTRWLTKKAWVVVRAIMIASFGILLWWFISQQGWSLGIKNPFASKVETFKLAPVPKKTRLDLPELSTNKDVFMKAGKSYQIHVGNGEAGLWPSATDGSKVRFTIAFATEPSKSESYTTWIDSNKEWHIEDPTERLGPSFGIIVIRSDKDATVRLETR